MTVGVLLLTHDAIGPAMRQAARHVMGQLPLSVECVEVGADCQPEAKLAAAAVEARALDHGDGVLVLTDIFGATPCNVARRLDDVGVRCLCVAGLNLPMLLRVLNYADQPLAELARIAVSGGRNGTFLDNPGPDLDD